MQTEKVASLGQLTAGIAHEIKNPLNFVNNFAALSVELVDELDDVLKPAALDAERRDGAARSSVEGPVMGLEQRGCIVRPWPSANWKREEPVDKAKPFKIPKREVWEAFKRVKANQGAAGVDGQSIVEFEANLSGNLYKLWNRLSSGSYFPPPVRRVEIPKASGGTRPLSIPTVVDRIAQEVALRYLEQIVEPVFHADSYGYRPGKSAVDAVHQARQGCWRYDWVLDLDIKGFFSIDWGLLLKAAVCGAGR